MAWKYIEYEYPVAYQFEKILTWTDSVFRGYFALKLENDDSWTYFAGVSAGDHGLASGALLTEKTNEAEAQSHYWRPTPDSNYKTIAILPNTFLAKYVRLYVDDSNDNPTVIHEFHPSTRFVADELVAGEIHVTDDFLTPPTIRVTSNSIDRIKLGKYDNRFGIAGFDDTGATIFELSDTDVQIAGWGFTPTEFQSPASAVILDAEDKQIRVNDGTRDRVWLGMTNATDYGLKVDDPDGNTIVKIDDADMFLSGFDVTSTYIATSNVLFTSTGRVVVGSAITGEAVFLDSTEASFRIWVGATTAETASFRVDKTGKMWANGAVITGSLEADVAELGGWDVTSSHIYSLQDGTPDSGASQGMVLQSVPTSQIHMYHLSNEVLRLGSLADETGLFIWDTAGELSAKYTQDGGITLGSVTASNYLGYSGGVLTIRGGLNADDITTGSLSANYIEASTITAEHLLIGQFVKLPSDEDLAAYWSLDDGAGTVAVDNSGNGNDGTLYNTPTWVASAVSGGGVHFNQTSNEYIDIPDTLSLTDYDTGFSVSLWFNNPSNPSENDCRLLSLYQDNSNWFTAYLHNCDYVAHRCEINGAGERQERYDVDGVYSQGDWHHVVFVIGSSGRTELLVFDGESVATTNSGDWKDPTLSAIGGGYGTTHQMHGMIDEVRVYKSQLTLGEAKALYLYPGGNRTGKISGAQTPWAASSDYTKIDGGNIETDTVDTDQLNASSVTTTVLAASSVTTDILAASAVTTFALAASAVTTDILAASSVTAFAVAVNNLSATEIKTLRMSGKECIFDSGTVGGWTMAATYLKSNVDTGADIILSQASGRVMVTDGAGDTKVAMGYLNGLQRGDQPATDWTWDHYGFWAKQGDKLVIDGNASFVDGDWIIEKNAAYKIVDSSYNVIVKLGTKEPSGEKGLFFYSPAATTLAEYKEDGIRIGSLAASQYLDYTLAGGLKIRGGLNADDITVGSLSAISADMGTITAGRIELANDGWIRTAGKDSFSDNTDGFWLGYDSGYKLNVGNATSFMKWDGSLTVQVGDGDAIKVFGDNTSPGEIQIGANTASYMSIQANEDGQHIFLSPSQDGEMTLHVGGDLDGLGYPNIGDGFKRIYISGQEWMYFMCSEDVSGTNPAASYAAIEMTPQSVYQEVWSEVADTYGHTRLAWMSASICAFYGSHGSGDNEVIVSGWSTSGWNALFLQDDGVAGYTGQIEKWPESGAGDTGHFVLNLEHDEDTISYVTITASQALTPNVLNIQASCILDQDVHTQASPQFTGLIVDNRVDNTYPAMMRFSATDIGHDFTDLTTDETFMEIKNFSLWGGGNIIGYTDQYGRTPSLVLSGCSYTAPNHTHSSRGIVTVEGWFIDGNATQSCLATHVILAVMRGGLTDQKFSVDGRGGVYVASAISIGLEATANFPNSEHDEGLVIKSSSSNWNEIVIKGDGIAHGMTTYAETDTHTTLGKISTSQGGAKIEGLTEGYEALNLNAFSTSRDNNVSFLAQAPLVFNVGYKSGTSVASLSSSYNAVIWQDDNQNVAIMTGGRYDDAAILHIGGLGLDADLGSGNVVKYVTHDSTDTSATHLMSASAISGISGAPRGYIDGFKTQHAADTDHDITVRPGACRDDSDSDTITTATYFIKRIDASWSEGGALGGMRGTLSANTWYHMYLIKRSDTGVVDMMFNASSPDDAGLPTSYDYKRRIGSVRTDSSSNIYEYIQDGDWFYWANPTEDIDEDIGTSKETHTIKVPPDVRCMTLMHVAIYETTDAQMLYIYPTDVDDEAPNVNVPPWFSMGVGYVAGGNGGQGWVLSDTNSQIAMRSSQSSGFAVDAGVIAYQDRRGKDNND